MIKHQNLIFIESAMKSKAVVELVESASRSIWHRIPDVTSFEHTCYVNIGKQLAKGDIKSVTAMARYYINRAVARHIKRSKFERFKSVEELSTKTDDEVDLKVFEPVDVLANVESVLEIKETITLLAKGDRKREMILTAWSNGSTNDSELSDTLASVFGGQARSHRIFIQRFRIECQANYYALAV
jgi:hypothetical protein